MGSHASDMGMLGEATKWSNMFF